MLHLCRSFISVVSSWYDEDKEFEDKLDVELYSEEVWADLISIWMDEMGLISNPAMRKQVKNYRAYFNAKDRCLKVSTQNLKNYNDTFGYEVGDHYIVNAAHLIREACGQAGSQTTNVCIKEN